MNYLTSQNNEGTQKKSCQKNLYPKPRITLPVLYQIFHIYQVLFEETFERHSLCMWFGSVCE